MNQETTKLIITYISLFKLSFIVDYALEELRDLKSAKTPRVIRLTHCGIKSVVSLSKYHRKKVSENLSEFAD